MQKEEKVKFEKDYYKMDVILNVMEKDDAFRQQMKTTKIETQ